MNRQERQIRDSKIVEMYVTGQFTAEEVATLFGIKFTQRIFQILNKAGIDRIEVRKKKVDVSIEIFKKLFWEWIEKKQQIPNLTSLLNLTRNRYKPNVIPIYRQLVKEAKAKGYKKFHGKSIKKEILLSDLKNMAQELGRTPTVRDILRHNRSHVTYINTFGSIKNAQIEAGLKPNTRGAQRKHERA